MRSTMSRNMCRYKNIVSNPEMKQIRNFWAENKIQVPQMFQKCSRHLWAEWMKCNQPHKHCTAWELLKLPSWESSINCPENQTLTVLIAQNKSANVCSPSSMRGAWPANHTVARTSTPWREKMNSEYKDTLTILDLVRLRKARGTRFLPMEASKSASASQQMIWLCRSQDSSSRVVLGAVAGLRGTSW